MISINNRQQNSEADNLFERISEIFNSEEYCFHVEDAELLFVLIVPRKFKSKVESMMLQNEDLEDSLTSVKSLD